MQIHLVTPGRMATRGGNRVTADRWARILRALGHRVRITSGWHGEPTDLLVALHARKSASSVRRFRERHPDKPIVLALTGTDVYGDIATSLRARRSLSLASRLIVLQPLAAKQVPARYGPIVRVIYQSVPKPPRKPTPDPKLFQVCVLGHLRRVKDPFRAAKAVRGLPPSSRIKVLHAGKALLASMATRAEDEVRTNPRYRWLGDLPHGHAQHLLAKSRLMVLSSRAEGGANVISEALAHQVPVLASRIPGTIGLLGEEYPGYFEVGDTRALTALLDKAETEPDFYESLKAACRRREHLIDPQRERSSWRLLLEELGLGRRPARPGASPRAPLMRPLGPPARRE